MKPSCAPDTRPAWLSLPAKGAILAGKQPLGGILIENEVVHSSKPSNYFIVRSDPIINSALHLSEPSFLYGRRNTLYTEDNSTLAEIVEILPP